MGKNVDEKYMKNGSETALDMTGKNELDEGQEQGKKPEQNKEGRLTIKNTRAFSEFYKLVQPDNLNFSLPALTGLLGFVVNILSLMNLSGLSWPQLSIFLLLSLGFFSLFIFPIYRRYRYYSEIVHKLHTSDKPSYLFYTYLAHKLAFGKKIPKNHLDIQKVEIEYHICCVEQLLCWDNRRHIDSCYPV